MRSSCIRHPEKEPLIMVRRWQLEATGGNRAAAALLSFFEYWHNVKLEQARKASQANDVAERHQDGRPHDEGLIQHHNEQELKDGTLLFGRNTLNGGIEVLEELGFIEVVPNPNPRYKFDKTRHFVFHPEKVNGWLDRRSDHPVREDRSSETGGRSSEIGSRSSHLGGTSPETTNETTNETSDAGASGDDAPEPDDQGPPKPTGGMFLRLFDEDLGEVRAAYPGRARRPLSGKWRKTLKRDAEAELAAGREPAELRRAVSRLALRIDGYPGMELAEAMNDVLDGKPWSLAGEARARAVIEGGAEGLRGATGAERRRRDFDWLFGEETGPGEAPVAGGGEGPPPGEPPEEPPAAKPPRGPEKEPWEGSAFADVVPHEGWDDLADPGTAGGIRRRLLEIAAEADDGAYGAAVEELRGAPWVGEAFKDSVIGKAAAKRKLRSAKPDRPEKEAG